MSSTHPVSIFVDPDPLVLVQRDEVLTTCVERVQRQLPRGHVVQQQGLAAVSGVQQASGKQTNGGSSEKKQILNGQLVVYYQHSDTCCLPLKERANQ